MYGRLVVQEGHDGVLVMRVGQVIEQCLVGLGALWGIDGADVEVSRKEYDDYAQIIANMIVRIMQ